jgi:GTPase involved in cell partitioning and DNA repair
LNDEFGIIKAPLPINAIIINQAFIDRVRVHVKGGGGGQGSRKMGRSGGQGGDVVAVAEETVTSLRHLLQGPSRLAGGSGDHASSLYINANSGKGQVV